MKRIEWLLNNAFIGLGVGSVASTVSIAVMNGMDDTIRQVLVWLAASAVFGIISGIMCMDFANLPVRTVIHFALCFLLAVTVGDFLDYSTGWFAGAKAMLPAFLLIYMVIYISVYSVRIVQTRRLNQRLKG